MLQYYPPICDLRHTNFTKVDFMNEISQIGLSQIKFEIINTPKMDNRVHVLAYNPLLQHFPIKYQFGHNFTVLTSITSGIRDFTEH